MAEKLNITSHYDSLADVLYVDFGSQEPCFTDDFDGFIMLDIGWFSHLPRGLRIVGPKEHKITSMTMKMEIKKIVRKAERACKRLMEEKVKQIKTEEPIFDNILKQALNQAFARVTANR